MGVTNKDLRYWIDKMLIKKGIDKYTLHTSGSSSKGDGYIGDINFVKVICDQENEEKKVFDIVIKSAKTDSDARKNLPIVETYERETMMYTQVFPIIEDFQKENAIEKQFSNYAECFSFCLTDNREALLLKNLKSLGYVVHDRMVPQNPDHVTFVFKRYAMLHGSTIALKLKKPELFKAITKDMTDLLGDYFKNPQNLAFLDRCVKKSMTVLRERGEIGASQKIECALSDILKVFDHVKMSEHNKEAAILHGDCWNNNMMFKYKENDTSKPISMKFLDFQCSRVGSPILDLSYYLYSVSDKSTLDEFDYYLEEYHKTLTEYLQQFDINSDDIYTLKKLKESWKEYGKFGLIMCPFILKVELSQEDEIMDFTKEAAKMLADIDVDNMNNQQEYDRRIFDVFHHFAKKFL